MIIKYCYSRVLKWALSINWATFLKILPILREAARLYPKPDNATKELATQINVRRATYAADEIQKVVPDGVKGAGINFLREVGLMWLRGNPEQD